jgi:hypothetical protein
MPMQMQMQMQIARRADRRGESGGTVAGQTVQGTEAKESGGAGPRAGLWTDEYLFMLMLRYVHWDYISVEAAAPAPPVSSGWTLFSPVRLH